MMASSSRGHRRSASREDYSPSQDRITNAFNRIEEGPLLFFSHHSFIVASTFKIDKGILSNAIDTVTTHAESKGLTAEQITRLIDVVVLPDGLDRGSVTKIINSLFPSGKIDEESGVKIIGCLGLGSQRAPLQTQVWSRFEKCMLMWVGGIIAMVGYGVSLFDFK